MPTKKTKKISGDACVCQPTLPAKTMAVRVKSEPRPAPVKKSRFLVSAAWLAIALLTGGTCFILSQSGEVSDKSAAPKMPTEEPLKVEKPEETDPSLSYRESGKKRLLASDTVGALNDFTIAIEKNPNNSLNFVYRGEVLMSGANFEAAVSDFNSALRIDPLSIAAYYDRALANIKLEKLSDAKTDLDQAIDVRAMHPDSEVSEISTHDLYAKRAQANLWLRNWADAESDYSSAISQSAIEPDWNDYTGRAEARTNSGDYKDAIDDYVTAVTIISEKIQKTPDEKTRENMSRQAMGYFEKSGALRVKMGQMDLAFTDLQAAHTLAIALNDTENKNRLQILMSSIK